MKQILFFLASITAFAQAAGACTCIWLPSPCKELISANSILFIGTPQTIEKPQVNELPLAANQVPPEPKPTRYVFRIDEKFSGLTGQEEVELYSFGDFEGGKQYLVEAGPGENGKLWESGCCSHTRPLSYATALITQLRAIRDGLNSAALFGILRYDITKLELDPDGPDGDVDEIQTELPLPHTRIEIRNEKGHAHWTLSKVDGTFMFRNLPAGTYEVTAPKHETAADSFVLGADSCFEVDLHGIPTGTISGRLRDVNFKPIEDEDIMLIPADPKERDWVRQVVPSDEGGLFRFESVAPGRYLIVANYKNELYPNFPYPRTFYPGVTRREEAQEIEIKEGEEFRDADIRMGKSIPHRTLTVNVLWKDRPAPEGLWLSIEPSEGHEPYETKITPNKFEVPLLKGVSYVIAAWISCSEKPEERSKKQIRTESIAVDGSNAKTREITLRLTDSTCRVFPPPNAEPHLP